MKGRPVAFWATVAALVAVAAMLLLSGGGTPQLVPSTAVSQAADVTSRQGSAQLTMNATVSTTANGQPVNIQMNGDGALDFRHQLGSMSLQVTLPPGGEGVASTDDLTFDEVFDNYVIYMRSPLLAAELPAGKEWLSIDLNAVSKQMGVDLQQIAGLGVGADGDPSQLLDQLHAVSDRVEQVGQEDVGGIPTTHYSATIDLRRYPSLAKPSDRAAVRSSVERLIQLSGQSEVPIDAWVDDHRLVRRMRMSLSQRNPATGSTMNMVMDMELSDFGAPVDVQVPPASDTIDVRDLLGSSFGSALGATPG